MNEYNRIQRPILLRHLAEATMEQLSQEYGNKGYRVTRGKKIADFQADLVAEKEDEIIIFEFKAGELTESQKGSIKKIRKYLKGVPKAELRLILITPPKEPVIEIEDLESVLWHYLVNNFPPELDRLSTHTSIEEIADIEIEEVYIRKNEIEVSGFGTVSVELSFGSDSDRERGDGASFSSSCPLEFHILLDHDLKITQVIEINIDTSEV